MALWPDEGGVMPAEPSIEALQIARAYVAKAKGAPPPPTHVADQLEAASRDVRDFFRGFLPALAAATPGRRWQAYDNIPEAPDELTARMLVALGSLRACPHLRNEGPQPAWGRLPLHRLDCARCIRTVRKPPAGEDDRCDWCGARGVEIFKPFAIQQGPLVLIGDACPTCAEALQRFWPQVPR